MAGAAGPAQLILAKLDEIFPGHDIAATDIVRDLSIGRRQMVEVARAFTVTDKPLHLVILDEPTSSLDAHTAGQLLAFMRRAVAGGTSTILISHLLGEVLDNSDRIVVMRDGKIVAAGNAAAFDRQNSSPPWATSRSAAPRLEPLVRRRLPNARCACAPGRRRRPTAPSSTAHEGEIIGLAGLAGHGQTRLILDIFGAAVAAASQVSR